MKIPILGRIFSREDLNLKSKWWHRLLSIIFIVSFIYFVGYNIVDFSTHDMFRGGHAQQWNKVATLSERITPEIKPISEPIKAGEKIGEDNRTYVLGDQIDRYYKMILNDVYCSTELSEDYEEVKSARNIDELYIGGSFGRNKVSSDEFSKHIKQSAIKCLIVDGYLSSDNKNVAILNPDKSYQDSWSFYEKAPLKTAIYFVEMITAVLVGSIVIFALIAMVYYRVASCLISNKNTEEVGRDKRTTLPTKGMNNIKNILLFSVAGVVILLGVYALGVSKGKGVPQAVDNQRLNDLQKSIDSQSSKIDDLQKENTDKPNVNTSAGIQAIIQSSIDKADRENKENCQQDLSEYNTCLGEYTSKMAEYNSCLTESSNPDSWRYKSYCSKPSNYCFKPVCAY